MAGKDIIMVSQGELKRLHIIKKVAGGAIRQTEAATLLSLSTRQIRRILKRVQAEGDRGIIHRSRGRPSNRRFPQKLREKTIQLYRERYWDFGPTLAAEKLCELNKITVNDETLRKWLIASGDWKKSRKRRTYRQWRQRKAHCGEMLQMDGSQHDWFEGRGSRCVFMGYVDDATGRAFGRFYGYEGRIPAMDSFMRYIRQYGIPVSVYLDKHSTYKSPAKPSIEDELNDREPLSEFERALKELGVEVIHAHSPQAKGRIERVFGTLQDRLVKELRLRGIQSIEEANTFLDEYLPIYNKKFALRTNGKGDLHRRIPRGLNLHTVFCIKTERLLRNDFTVAHNNKLYQVANHIRASHVVVHDRIDGSTVITHKGTPLTVTELPTRPSRGKKRPVVFNFKKKYNPPPQPAHHPWKSFKIGKRKHEAGKLRGSLK